MSVLHISDENFREVVLDAKGPVLVDFRARWCGPCQMMAPVLEQLADACPQVTVAELDTDESPAVAMAYEIDSIPCFLLFRGGTVVKRVVGAMPLDALRSQLGL